MGNQDTQSAPVPPRPQPTGAKLADRLATHSYYVANREAILKDLAELGQKKTMKRWGISSASSIHLIRHGWKGTKGTGKKRGGARVTDCNSNKHKEASATIKLSNVKDNNNNHNHHLPPFPLFDNNWDPSVQIEWIEAYRELAKV